MVYNFRSDIIRLILGDRERSNYMYVRHLLVVIIYIRFRTSLYCTLHSHSDVCS